MSKDEKIYYEKGDVIVTASRVVLGDKNFVLRNISSVQVESVKAGNPIWFWACAAFMGFLGIMNMPGVPILGFILIIMAVGFLCAALFLKDSHYVQVSSGGTPTNTVKSDTIELPKNIVEAINNALLDLDKNKESKKSNDESDGGTSATDEVMKLKGLLDAGALTQEEFDAKKKELLGL